jgi:hypothetical protein
MTTSKTYLNLLYSSLYQYCSFFDLWIEWVCYLLPFNDIVVGISLKEVIGYMIHILNVVGILQ